jgi:thiamine biosynthesis lipoprotein
MIGALTEAMIVRNLIHLCPALLCPALLCMAMLVGCAQPQVVSLSGQTMGTTYSVKVVGATIDQQQLAAVIDERLQQINQLMSTYISASELSQFNDAPLDEWFDVSPETQAVIELAKDISTLSDGSFDVTVGPLVNLWGFGPQHIPDHVPSMAEIDDVRERVGFGFLQVREGALRKEAALYVDLSSIAKGFAVDEIVRLLEARELNDYLVEVGGELRARGKNPGGKIWRVAIELPEAGQRMPYQVVELADMGMATSGDYRNYFERDGVRYSHTIDPATGYPIRHNLASVTVLAKSTARADAMATAISVMGADPGLALAEAQGLAVFVILKTPEGFEAKHSTAFTPYLSTLMP